MRKSKFSKEHSQYYSSTQLVSNYIENYSTASQETKKGMELLLKVAKQYENCKPDITQGRLFEVIETSKFNSKAAEMGEKIRSMTTDSLSDPHSTADILIKVGEKVLKEVQAKSSDSSAWLARAISKKKYGDMDRLINKEKVNRVQELVDKRASGKGIYKDEYTQSSEHIKGELKLGGISSGGTTHKEALKAAENPSDYAHRTNTQQFGKHMFHAARDGAIAGALLGGGIAAISEGVKVYRGENTIKSSATVVGKSSAKASMNSALVASLGKGISYVGKDTILVKGNIATSVAASAVRIAKSTINFIKGDLSSDEYIQDIGETGVSTLSGIYAGMAAGVVFGPGGAIVGSIVGMLAGKEAFNALMLAQKELNLTIEERKRAEMLSKIIIKQIEEEQNQLKKLVEQEIDEIKGLSKILENLNDSIYNSNFLTKSFEINQGILTLAEKLNVEFQYNTKEEFDDFMFNDDEELKL